MTDSHKILKMMSQYSTLMSLKLMGLRIHTSKHQVLIILMLIWHQGMRIYRKLIMICFMSTLIYSINTIIITLCHKLREILDHTSYNLLTMMKRDKSSKKNGALIITIIKFNSLQATIMIKSIPIYILIQLSKL